MYQGDHNPDTLIFPDIFPRLHGGPPHTVVGYPHHAYQQYNACWCTSPHQFLLYSTFVMSFYYISDSCICVCFESSYYVLASGICLDSTKNIVLGLISTVFQKKLTILVLTITHENVVCYQATHVRCPSSAIDLNKLEKR